MLRLLHLGPWDGAGVVMVLFDLEVTLRHKRLSFVGGRIVENGVHLILQHRDIVRFRDV